MYRRDFTNDIKLNRILKQQTKEKEEISTAVTLELQQEEPSPDGNYMFKVNNRNTRKRREICSKLTIKIPERRHWRRSGIFIVNFEHISHLVLLCLLLTLSR